MYHRVAEAPEDAYGLAVSPDRFAAHAEHLSRLRCVVPLTDIQKPSKQLQIAITFDDGYVDNATTAAPLLASLQLPATYFITTGQLGGRHFWWDRLAVGLLGAHDSLRGVAVKVGGRDLWLALNSPEARRTALQFLHRRLRPLPPEELAEIVNDLLERMSAPQAPAHARTMSEDQVREMSLIETVDIGAHTRTHLQLRDQAPDLQRNEVFGSMADVAAIIGRPVTTFAYPFGSQSAVGKVARRLAQQAGCQLACSTDDGAVSRRTDRYWLPRLNVENWQAAEFAARIDEASRLG